MEKSMMGRFKVAGTGVVAVFSLMIAILPASSAMAASHLELTEGGPPVAVGSPGDTGVSVANCSIFTEGTVAINGAAKDVLKATKNARAECSEESTGESGTVTETQITSKGGLTLKAKLEVTEAGPCVYAFSKFKTTFAVPGPVVAEGTTVGKLNKKLSSKTCEKTQTKTWFADATNEPAGVPFEAELK